MIKQLRVSNFKCFQSSPTFEFSNINLLTGINGRGKSSLLQAILVLSQSLKLGGQHKLMLNGQYVSLGNYDDIKNSDTPRSEPISFMLDLISFDISVQLDFVENEADPMTAVLSTIRYNSEMQPEDLLNKMASVLNRVHYVSADRLGPVKYVDKISLPNFAIVGPKGEHTINILAEENLPLVNESLYRGSDARTVIQQTEEWLSYILDGAKIRIGGKERESRVLYTLISNRSGTHSYKASNVGFGYSYALPIIVSGLIARAGQILIVENPEAHLHPRAQSRIIEFLARIAATGVQVFVESHSEHILNGLRLASLNPEIGLDRSEFTIQYFNESFVATRLELKDNGRIENWPNGFFDQQEIDLSEIFRLGS